MDEGVLPDDYSKDLQQTTQMFVQLCQLLMDQLKIDLADQGMQKFANDPNFESAFMAFAGMAISAEVQEQGTLQTIQSSVETESAGYSTAEAQANADLSVGHHWYDKVKDYFLGASDSSDLHDIVNNADAMMGLLSDIEALISPMIQVVDPGMQ